MICLSSNELFKYNISNVNINNINININIYLNPNVTKALTHRLQIVHNKRPTMCFNVLWNEKYEMTSVK